MINCSTVTSSDIWKIDLNSITAHSSSSPFWCSRTPVLANGSRHRNILVKIQTRNHYHPRHLSLNREGRWGTTDDFATSFLHLSLFPTALWDFEYSRPVHSLMLSSHLFLCLTCLLAPFTVTHISVVQRGRVPLVVLCHFASCCSVQLGHTYP